VKLIIYFVFCSVYLILNHWILLPIWNGAHGGCDRSVEDAYSSAVPDSTFAFVEGLCCPTLDFVIALWITIAFYTLLTSLFCIYNYIFEKLEFSNFYQGQITSKMSLMQKGQLLIMYPFD
jgi:hypothetical protein